ncbi:P-loop containing nucleoside triphosphate hydrolase protein [Sphaerosporella brunnea]|uniref:P-loop containing nucleoside triphosphate hydrolase protein n=1 Tax=Sphaerosporella brunnea TaxID=1250544 RepID=A0A5J5F8C0_9PEZI|nr:P-loop containing nucleoside triphosphate hydrolase protein [Sphaerosporella brunnea]
MRAGERDAWRFFMEHTLFETRYIFEGLVFTDIQYKNRKRSFRVEKISVVEESASTPPPEKRADAPNPSPVVPAFLMTEHTTLKLLTETIPEPAKKTKDKPTVKPTLEEDKPKALVPAKPIKPSTTLSSTPTLKPSNVTFSQIGGLYAQIHTLRTLLISVFEDAEEFSRRGLVPPRGVLMYGPSGTGKTMMMKAAATAFASTAKSYVVDGKVMGKYQGESEAAIRKIFAEARQNQPSIIFMDEVDTLAHKRSQGSGEGTEGRVVSTLLMEMDAMETVGADGSIAKVAIVAATNRPNSIDESLRRSGRFEKELEIGIPDADARREILTLLTRKLEFESEGGKTKDEMIAALAARTHGYVGADLEAVVRGAFTLGLDRRRNVGSNPDLADAVASLSLTNGEKPAVIISPLDLEASLKSVKPTAMREIFIEPPKVRWSDIGGQEEVKQALREAVEWPLTHPEVFARLGGTPRKGLLLYGPPGCSKTLTAKALATEAGLNFMAIKGPELFSMYVGESERAVREVFRKARAASPSIIFFDEIDALTANREGKSGGGANVLTALLNEMDGIEALKNVVVLAATNRPEIIDPALMRPGRLDTILYVGPPDFAARKEILRIKTSKMSITEDVDIEEIAQHLDGYSGAEIVNICDEAIHYAMRESFDIQAVKRKHFAAAVLKSVPQITMEMRRKYEQWSVGGVKKI